MRRFFEIIFPLVMAGCIQFPILTSLAMLAYPGGTYQAHTSRGYQFFNNFFSDLGLSRTYSGGPKPVSFFLFFVALTLAGLAEILFFSFAPRLFKPRRLAYVLSLIGSVFGVISGLSYIGVALTPADLYLSPHALFVQLAFVSFLVAVLFYIPAILLTPDYPRGYAWTYLAFALLLAGYIWLMFTGPSAFSSFGLTIQATGQKVIVYSAILAMFIQAYGAWRLVQSGSQEPLLVNS
jgi:hypothetical protein